MFAPWKMPRCEDRKIFTSVKSVHADLALDRRTSSRDNCCFGVFHIPSQTSRVLQVYAYIYIYTNIEYHHLLNRSRFSVTDRWNEPSLRLDVSAQEIVICRFFRKSLVSSKWLVEVLQNITITTITITMSSDGLFTCSTRCMYEVVW